jgi:hypothetical protein
LAHSVFALQAAVLLGAVNWHDQKVLLEEHLLKDEWLSKEHSNAGDERRQAKLRPRNVDPRFRRT